MSFTMSGNRPLDLQGAHKTELRTQFAVLPYRVAKKGPRVCLVSSRGSGRWIVPKGWPMSEATPIEAAAAEAWEEAGLEGPIHPQPVGVFSYRKMLEDNAFPVLAVVYAMKVVVTHKTYPEVHQRSRKWVSPKKASGLLSDPELARIVRDFDPRALRS